MKSERIQLLLGGCWILPPDASPPEDSAPPAQDASIPPEPIELPDDLRLDPGEPVDASITLYDTWEWNLWHAGKLLVGDGRALRILDGRKMGQALAHVPLAVPPRFAGELPEGPLAQWVAPLLGLRALSPVATLEARQRTWCVTNADDKIVVRILDQTWSDGVRTLALRPLRGYEEEAQVVAKRMPATSASDRHPFAHALEAAGVQPRTWTNKPAFDFSDKTPAHEAVVSMVRTMLALARQTETGIIDDVDTEFLHDYRVLLRKARSVLSLTKGVLDPDGTAKLRATLRTLAQRTNALRDLDVHVMEQDAHVARVPVRLRAGLTPMHTHFVKRRTEVQAAVAKTLAGRSYLRTVRALERQIEHVLPGPKGAVPTRKLADKKLGAQLADVLAYGRAITSTTPDEAVHALRIECKKLRYLLEFFRHMYPDKQLMPMVKALKRLQDLLGRFNDRSVQQDALLSWVRAAPKVPVQTAVSVGALIGALADEQRALRQRVEETFAAFDEPERYEVFLSKARRRKKVTA